MGPSSDPPGTSYVWIKGGANDVLIFIDEMICKTCTMYEPDHEHQFHEVDG